MPEKKENSPLLGNGDGMNYLIDKLAQQGTLIDELTHQVSNHLTGKFLENFKQLRELLDAYHKETQTQIKELEESFQAKLNALEKKIAESSETRR